MIHQFTFLELLRLGDVGPDVALGEVLVEVGKRANLNEDKISQSFTILQ